MTTATKTFVLAEVKSVDTKEPNGEFEAILSAPTLDRDGEVIDKGAFEPLPDTIPIHAFHDFSDPIGRAQPFYDGDLLKVRGYYASTPRAQEMRALVAEGVVANMSVGFMSAEREVVDKVPHITKGEILEGSFVSIPSNREAAVLAAKEYAAKAGARNNANDADRLQQIHDLAVENGADCDTKAARDVTRKSVAGSYEAQRDTLRDAVRAQHPDAMWAYVLATFPDHVIYEIETPDGSEQFEATYEIDDEGSVSLSAGIPVDVVEVVQPAKSATNPEEKAAAPAAADPPAEVPLQHQMVAEIARSTAVLLTT